MYERESYNLMMMIGDFGGFNGAIMIVPTLFMGLYNSSMYQYEVTSEIPTKRKSSKRTRKD